MKTFSEWIKYWMANPYSGFDYSTYIDKHKVKEFVSPVIKTAKEYAYFTIAEEIDNFNFNTLPNAFVIKATHASGWFMIVNKGVCIDKKYFVKNKPIPFNKKLAISEMKKWLSKKWVIKIERQYEDVIPGIIIEEYLGNDDEEHLYLNDYKFNCINGEIEFIRHCDSLDMNQGYFDTDWNLLPFKRMKTKNVTNYPKPVNLDAMIKVVKKLLQEIKNPPFVRIDIYNTDKGIYFGEFTFSPSKGNSCRLLPVNSNEDQDKYEKYYGKLIDKGIMKVICFKWKHLGGFRLPSLNVVGEYKADHVNRLYHSVERNTTIPHEFICVTDDPKGIECKTIPMWEDHRELGGCFTRLKMFSSEMKDLIGERFIMLDLDTVIVGNLNKMFSRKGDFIMNKYTVRNYSHKHKDDQYYNGSIIMMDAGARNHVWKMFDPKISPLLVQKNKGLIGTDQAWISLVLGEGEKMFTEKDGVYRFQLLPNNKKLPKDAKLVLFAGNEDPSKRQSIGWIKENWV